MFNPETLQTFLARFVHTRQFWIAYSGGLDSHVLLHALAKLPQKLPLRAIHINHGWHADAKQWAEHCVKTCAALGIECDVVAVNAQPQIGESLEAIARVARYQAFAEIMEESDCLLTAHQQDDQAETLLLQLMRGAGVKGLASIAEVMPFAKGYLARPLLHVSRAELQAYAEQQQLSWIEDASNYNTKFDRNFVRQELMPIIQQRWPQASTTLARSAHHCAEAAELLDVLGAEDLEKVVNNPPALQKVAKRPPFSKGVTKDNNILSIKKLLQLTPVRLRNVLRYWLRQLNFSVPSEAQLEQIHNTVLMSSIDANPKVSWDNVEIRRYQDDLYASIQNCRGDRLVALNDIHASQIIWDLTQALEIPNIGILKAEIKLGQGIRCSAIPDKKVTVKFRSHGERFHPAGRQGSHPLKKLMQEWQIPPWQRDQIPLIYYAEELIAVVGYAISEQFAAQIDENGWVISL